MKLSAYLLLYFVVLLSGSCARPTNYSEPDLGRAVNGDDLQECYGSDLESCRQTAENNVLYACGAGPGDNLPSGRHGVNPKSTILGHGLLRLVHLLSPKSSWLDPLMREGTDSVEFADLYEKWGDSLAYTPTADISIVLGLLMLLLMPFFLCPVLWCRCTRKGCFANASERKRTSRLTVIICSAVLLVLSLLFYYGAVWYTFWGQIDLNASPCTVAGLSYQTLYETRDVGDGDVFNGVNSLLTDIETASETIQEYAKELPNLSEIDFVMKAFTGAFAPLLWTSQMLHDREFIGWTGTSDPTGVDDRFKLNMISAVHPNWGLVDAGRPTDAPDFTIKWVETYGEAMTALSAALTAQGSGNPFGPGGSAESALQSAVSGFSEAMNLARDTVNDLIRGYNKLISVVKTAISWGNFSEWGWVGLKIFSCLPALGVIAGVIIFVHYYITNQHIDPVQRPGHKMTRFAGFMAFGYTFYAFLLLLFGGVFLLVSYWLSDACEIVGENIIEDGRWQEYNQTINLSQEIIDACLLPDSPGDFVATKVDSANVDQITSIQLPGLEKLPAVSFTVDTTALRNYVDDDTKWDAMTYLFGSAAMPDANSIPLLTGTLDLWRASTPELNGYQCATTPSPSLAKMCRIGGVALRTSSSRRPSVNVLGLRELGDHLSNYYLGSNAKKICFYECDDGILVDETNVVNLPGDQWTPATNNLYQSASKELRDATNFVISDKPNKVGDWLNALRHGVRLALVRKDLRRSTQGKLPETFEWNTFVKSLSSTVTYTFPKGISDPCPPNEACPIFYQLNDRSDIGKGYKLVNYDAWKLSVRDDTRAAIEQLDSADKLMSYIKTSGTSQTSVSGFSSQFQSIRTNYNCKALRRLAQDVKYRICEDFFADIACMGWFWFLLGLCHIFAFVMVFMYWLARRRERDLEKENKDEPKEPTEKAPKVTTMKHTRGDFLQAAEHGDIKVVTECCNYYKANDVFDPEYHNSPLHLAAYYGHINCVKELIDHGWSPNELNFHHYTPTSACVTNHNLPFEEKSIVVTDLVNAGGNLEIFDQYGNTSLMIATRANEPELVQLLLKLGANPDKEDDHHLDSTDLARSMGHQELYELLVEASPSRSLASTRSPL